MWIKVAQVDNCARHQTQYKVPDFAFFMFLMSQYIPNIGKYFFMAGFHIYSMLYFPSKIAGFSLYVYETIAMTDMICIASVWVITGKYLFL